MKKLALFIIAFSLIGCSSVDTVRTSLNNYLGTESYSYAKPEIKGRPVFYSNPPYGYIEKNSISTDMTGEKTGSCDVLADKALDQLIKDAISQGGHAVGRVTFSDCTNRFGRYKIEAKGFILLNSNLLPPQIAGIGGIFFSNIDGFNDFRFDLTVTELNPDKISLQYSEYFKAKDGSWMIKQGFNKTFTYALSDKIIRFKDYEFEVVGLDKGQLTYKRVK